MKDQARPNEDRRSWKAVVRRLTWVFGTLAVILVSLYFWQPLRVDASQRRPETPLPPVSLEEIGLWKRGAAVTVIVAHPDDEAFYVGGTLARLRDSGAVVDLIVLTNGDKGYYPFNDSARLAEVRQRETRASGLHVGARSVRFLNFPDGRLRNEARSVASVQALLEELKPEFVLAFDPEFPPRISHGDHRVAGAIAVAAMREARFTGWALHFSTFGANAHADISRHWPDVVKLLATHESQFFGEKLKAIEAMVMENAMSAGETFGVELAEPYRAVRMQNGVPTVPARA